MKKKKLYKFYCIKAIENQLTLNKLYYLEYDSGKYWINCDDGKHRFVYASSLDQYFMLLKDYRKEKLKRLKNYE